MNQYVIHLVFAVLFLLVACVCLFVLFRHIEIRKVEQQNVDAEEIAGIKRKRRHSGKDDMIVLLRVLLIVIFLVILMDEDKGTRWVMLVISYLLVSFLSLLFLAKSGTIAPMVRERKWEYLALFSVLVFAAGAAISLLNYSVLKMKYGKSYFGAARIVGYNEEDDAEEVAYYEENYDGGDEENDKGDENHEDREGENEDQHEDEGEGEDQHEGEGEGEGEDKHEEEGQGEGRRKLEDGNDEGGDEAGEYEDHDNGDGDDQASGDEYAYIKVAWGGAWGCPSNPNKYCTANIETQCSQWDVDKVYGSNTPADWKYWNGKVDGRLDGVFSCGYGFGENYGQGDYDASTSPLNADDAYPYAYVVGDCSSCNAKWAWTPYHRRSEEMSGYIALFQGYMILSGVALVAYAAITFRRHRNQKAKNFNNVELLPNEGGVSA